MSPCKAHFKSLSHSIHHSVLTYLHTCCDTTPSPFQRLKTCLENRLVDDFVNALEQLNSPELAWKDILEVDLQPLMEQSVSNRDKKNVKKIWAQIYAQLLDYRSWDSGPTSSLYGSQSTASLQAGQRMKRFAQVRRILVDLGITYMYMYIQC